MYCVMPKLTGLTFYIKKKKFFNQLIFSTDFYLNVIQ